LNLNGIETCDDLAEIYASKNKINSLKELKCKKLHILDLSSN